MTQSPAGFDEQFYLEVNPDVRASVNAGRFSSGLEHYLKYGKTEGRRFKRSVEVPDYSLMHPKPTMMSYLPFLQRDADVSEEKFAATRRLVAAYHASKAQNSLLKTIGRDDLWTPLVKNELSDLLRMIEDADALNLARALSDFGKTYKWFGGISTGVDGFNHSNRDRQSVAYTYFDKLVSLGEALGVLPAESPEVGAKANWGHNARIAPQAIVDAIESYLDIQIVPPSGVIHVAGLGLRQGLLHYRHINSLYLAVRIRDLTDPSDAVCEFGGGLGLAAFYLWKLGRTNTTLFDLPIVNVISGFFLICALGADAVCLEGEPQLESAVKIRAFWNCTEVDDKSIKLTANQDSFPEIDRALFDQYVKEIHRFTQKNFLSINHESEAKILGSARHINVSKVLRNDLRFKREYRLPYWLRRGYVEELYRIADGALPVSAVAAKG
jgi:hypothetical protein